jgi:hypothetical protein
MVGLIKGRLALSILARPNAMTYVNLARCGLDDIFTPWLVCIAMANQRNKIHNV